MAFSIEKISSLVNNRPIACLFLILALSLTLRVSRCFLTGRIDKDSVMYIAIAKGMAHDDLKYAFEINPRIPPLYIFGMSAGEKIGIGARVAGIIISVIAGSLLPLALFMAALKIFKDYKLALLSALMATVHPFLIRMSADIMRDSLFMSAFAFSFAFAVIAGTDKRILSWYWALSGFFAGLAAMTRSEGVEVLFAIIIWFGVEGLLKISKFREFRNILLRAAVSISIFIVVFGITTLPVEYALRDSSSEWHAMDRRVVGYLENFFRKQRDVLVRSGGDQE
ncbi:MAG: hypothetical protein A2020_02795 [Lentisphaerae bacterium GWF2_45_14]|nr:MAG: hypothetical protein A2020_02795 [Lentisphaerae bacterium GWF2_45_14]